MQFQHAPTVLYLYFCFLNSTSISVHLCDLACTRLQTSSWSSKPKTICFIKPCKFRTEQNTHVFRVKGQHELNFVMCCHQQWTNFGTLAVWMDNDRVLVHSLHKPVRQFLFQCSVEVNLRSASHIFSQVRDICLHLISLHFEFSHWITMSFYLCLCILCVWLLLNSKYFKNKNREMTSGPTCMASLFREAFLWISAMSPTAKPIYGANRQYKSHTIISLVTQFKTI